MAGVFREAYLAHTLHLADFDAPSKTLEALHRRIVVRARTYNKSIVQQQTLCVRFVARFETKMKVKYNLCSVSSVENNYSQSSGSVTH